MNPLYQSLTGNAPQAFGFNPASLNPMQKMNMIMQAMTNPAQFVRQAFPDIPDNISGNPNLILQYLQQTRGITNEQIQQTMNQMPQMPQMQRRW